MFTWKRRERKPRRRKVGVSWLMLEGLEQRTVLSFTAPVVTPTVASVGTTAIGKFNADGFADVAVANYAVSSTVSVMMGNGDGSFGAAASYPAGGYALDVRSADFNGDGAADLAVAGTLGTVNVLLGNGDGSFGTAVSYPTGSGAHTLATGDFNGDGKLDVATMGTGTASLLLGNGDGSFQAPLNSIIPGNSTNVIAGDFNKDGYLDLATSNTASLGTITVLRGHGDGSFDPASSYYAFSAPVYLSHGDYDEDGDDDFIVANSYAATSMSIIYNNGDGTYAQPQTYGIAQTGYEIESEDFNGDGHEDYAVRGGSMLMVHLGKGNGTFYPEVQYSIPSGRFQAGTTADVNGDGAPDMVYPTGTGVAVVGNAKDDQANLAGAVGFQVSAPASVAAGSTLPVTVTVVDAAGNAVPGFLGTVFLTTSDAAAPVNVAYTFTAADAGVHTFPTSVRFATQGAQTLYTSAPFMTQSATTVNVAPKIAKYAVSAPASSDAGATFSVTVTAQDALGNTATYYGSTVHFRSGDVQAGLPADYTFTPEDAGTHTFTVTLKSSGVQFVGVNEVGGAAAGGASVNVAAGVAQSLTLAGAGGAIGVARPVTVVARDAYGNVATGYTGTVHFTSSDPNAVLPADATLVAGVATANVTFMTVGTQSVTATDLADPSLTGTLFSNATPPVASLFTIAGPSTVLAGASANYTVTVRDTIGQVATGYTGTVYFTSSDVQAGLPASYTFTAADAGVHTFSLALKTAGAQTVTVRDYAGLTGSLVGVNVTPSTFAGYKLSVPFATDSKGHILLTAGDNIPLTVKAVDAYGNAVVGYKGKAHFTSTDTLALLPTDYSFTAADAGVHTFNVQLRTATVNGQVSSFSVADTSSAATLTTITNFEISNAPATKFTLNAPTNATTGTPFTVKLTASDAFGNKAKNYFGTVHLTSSAATTGLPADYTFNALDGGVHTFTVTLTTSATQTLTIFDVGSPTLLTASASISVKAGSTGGGGGGGGTGGGGSGGGGGKTP